MGKQVLSIKGDKEDPLSRGHLCPKSLALQDVQDDPDRLRRPMRKTARGFEPISWNDAFEIAEEKIGTIRAKYGDDSVATYSGNPNLHSYGGMVLQYYLYKLALRTSNNVSGSSLDQRPHHYAANQMHGHGMLLPVPDVDRTEYTLVLGANPAVSNGSLMTAPGIERRLREVQRRGRLVLIDPRQSETSRLADEHHFIRPGTDAYFLAGMLHVIFERGLTRLDRQMNFVKNIDRLRQAAERFPDTAVKESTHRVERAIVNSGITRPHDRVVTNSWLLHDAVNLVAERRAISLSLFSYRAGKRTSSDKNTSFRRVMCAA